MCDITRIEDLIASKGWSNSEFARRLGMSKGIVRDWKAGKSSPDKHLAKIAFLLETSEEYLRGETDEPYAERQITEQEVDILHEMERIGVLKDGKIVDRRKYKKIMKMIDSLSDVLDDDEEQRNEK